MCARNNLFIFLQYFRGADSSGKAFKYMFIYLIELIKQKPNNLEQFTIWKKQNLCLLFTFFMGGSRSWSRSRSRGRQKGGGWAVAYHCFVTLIFESFIFPLVWRPVCEPDIYKRKKHSPPPSGLWYVSQPVICTLFENSPGFLSKRPPLKTLQEAPPDNQLNARKIWLFGWHL